MLEFELRFKDERDISLQLTELGFRKRDELRMTDLIFEPKEHVRGSGVKPGYYVVRIRLVSGNRPRLELKEFHSDYKWDETAFTIDGPRHFVQLFSRIMVPSRVIEKRRDVWVNGALIVCFDDVKHLGKFVELEGPDLETKELALKLGFALEDHQPTYGSQLFYMQKMGLVSFHPDEMAAALKEFGH